MGHPSHYGVYHLHPAREQIRGSCKPCGDCTSIRLKRSEETIMLNILKTFFLDTLWNNGLALAIAGLAAYMGLSRVKSEYKDYKEDKKLEDQIEATVERREQDAVDESEIKKEAKDAIDNDPNNDFINQ